MNKLNINIKTSLCNIIFTAIYLFSPLKSDAQQSDSTKISIAEVKTIHSKILNQDRKIYIYTTGNSGVSSPPPSPVLYLMDGDIHTALVASQIQYLSEVYSELPTMMVVGIGNYNYDRMRDLTPTHSSLNYFNTIDSNSVKSQKTTGGGEKFLQFVEKEVMPFVESNYKTVPYKILSGHSLGGLMSLYCLTTHPEMFNAYIAVSPALWWDNGFEVKRTDKTLKPNLFKNKIFFYSDGNEGGIFHKSVLDLDSILNKNNNSGLRYKYIHYSDESHGSEPVKAEYDALKFIYSKWKPGPADTTLILINKFYKQLSAEYGYSVLAPEEMVNTLGYNLLSTSGKEDDAIQCFLLNVSNYPDSWNVYDSLGDAYTQKGNKEKAISSYNKALELNPKSEDTKSKLKSLQH